MGMWNLDLPNGKVGRKEGRMFKRKQVWQDFVQCLSLHTVEVVVGVVDSVAAVMMLTNKLCGAEHYSRGH
jgi:hypothetical protein